MLQEGILSAPQSLPVPQSHEHPVSAGLFLPLQRDLLAKMQDNPGASFPCRKPYVAHKRHDSCPDTASLPRQQAVLPHPLSYSELLASIFLQQDPALFSSQQQEQILDFSEVLYKLLSRLELESSTQSKRVLRSWRVVEWFSPFLWKSPCVDLSYCLLGIS